MGRLGCDVCTRLQQLLRCQPGNSSTWCSKWLGQFLPCKREQGKQDDVQDNWNINHYKLLILFLPHVISVINGAPKEIRYHTILNPYFWFLTVFCFQNPKGFPWRTILLVILCLVMDSMFLLEQPSGSSIMEYPRIKWLLRTFKRIGLPVSWL